MALNIVTWQVYLHLGCLHSPWQRLSQWPPSPALCAACAPEWLRKFPGAAQEKISHDEDLAFHFPAASKLLPGRFRCRIPPDQPYKVRPSHHRAITLCSSWGESPGTEDAPGSNNHNLTQPGPQNGGQGHSDIPIETPAESAAEECNCLSYFDVH